ncbi:mitochondrial ribosomal protein MRP51 [Phyllosticta citrichinensis]|uniref:Mitochondrial ribosomal protein MRP51 n=1 Tax=Phyllosticta citrichinensis TaxID=1130410 RepID=A0ABR1XLS5_9PEZI
MSNRMARKLSSPTAKLLRNSRLFSLPPPIPPPFEGDGAFQSSVGSETATQAFPTYQAIATPTSSLHRGDWGLKRPLPMRETTRSTAPAMRVFEVDTINFITDFESAGDHVRTLEKWQQLNMPISLPGRKVGASQTPKFVSVFNEHEDNTHLDAEMRSEGQHKWKYDGPWVGEMTTGEFEKFLKAKVQGAKRNFGGFLRKKITEAAMVQRIETARAEGTDIPKEHGFKISEEEYQVWIKKLREDTSLSSPLSRWIIQYFDMPDLREEARRATMGDSHLIDSGYLGSNVMSKPRTHPSAGLSYLRTRNFMDNDPILGPRDDYAPTKARLLGSQAGANINTKVGVAGVVTDLKKSFDAGTKDLIKYDFQQPGGHKMWVTPDHASIDSNGHITLEATHVSDFKVAAYTGEAFTDPETHTSKVDRSEPLPIPMPSLPLAQTSPKADGGETKDSLMSIIGPNP